MYEKHLRWRWLAWEALTTAGIYDTLAGYGALADLPGDRTGWPAVEQRDPAGPDWLAGDRFTGPRWTHLFYLVVEPPGQARSFHLEILSNSLSSGRSHKLLVAISGRLLGTLDPVRPGGKRIKI